MPDPGNRAGLMPQTHWSVVQRLGAEDTACRDAAFAEVCRHYWQPLYCLARVLGHSPQDAEDLTQAFLTNLYERRGLGEVSPERGRFRSLLAAAFRNFSIDAQRRNNAQSRGGRRQHVTLDFRGAEAIHRESLAVEPNQARLFDREWALAVMAKAVDSCRQEWADRDKGPVFDALEPVLVPCPEAPSYADLGGRLGWTEANVATTVKRLRANVGEHLRRAVADTVLNPDEVREELTYLISLL